MKKISSTIKVDVLTTRYFECGSTINDDALNEKIQKALDAFCHQEVFNIAAKTNTFNFKKFVSFFKNIDNINKVVSGIDTTDRLIFSLKANCNKDNKPAERRNFDDENFSSSVWWSQEFFVKKTKKYYKINCNFACLDDSIDLKDFKENIFKFVDYSKIAIDLELQIQDKNKIERSPFNCIIASIMKRLNKVYDNQYYISHWWNKEKQEANFTIRKKTWMEEVYNRESILNWLECFLPNFKRDIRPVDNEYYSNITYLGLSREFDIHVIESPKFLYASEIRGIAMMCWFNNLFVIHKRMNYRDVGNHWWRMDFWWSKNELSQSGKIKKNRQILTSDANTRHIYGPKKFIPHTYDISDDPNYTDFINYSAKNLEDVLNRMNIRRHSKIKNNDFCAMNNYPVVDFYTNINGRNH